MHVTGRYLEKDDFTLLHINGFASVTSNQKQESFKSESFVCLNPRVMKMFIAHHVKHLSILPGGEDHLWLQARLEEKAMSRHCAAPTGKREG